MSSSHTRPTHVVQRDRLVAVILLQQAQPLADVVQQLHASTTDTGASQHDVYRAVCRLRNQGLAIKVSTGSRTPQWGLTAEGVAYAQQIQGEVPVAPAPVVAVPAPAPEPVPAPAPVPMPVFDPPPVAVPEPAPVPEATGEPLHHHVIQPVPITPPPVV